MLAYLSSRNKILISAPDDETHDLLICSLTQQVKKDKWVTDAILILMLQKREDGDDDGGQGHDGGVGGQRRREGGTASAQKNESVGARAEREHGGGAGERDLRPLQLRPDLQVDPALLPPHVRGAQAQAMPGMDSLVKFCFNYFFFPKVLSV